MSKTIAVLDAYHKDAVALLKSTPDLNIIWHDSPERATWHGQADGAIIRSTSRLTEEDFQKATPRLKVVVKQGVGVDNIDLEAAKKYGVAVHNTPALNSEAVAEMSLALTLSLSRRVAEFDRRARNGEVIDRAKSLGISIFGKTVGIIGMGNIGRQAAKKWRGACDATLIGYDPVAPADVWGEIPHTRAQKLEDLVKEADIITLHVPLLPTTRGIIGEKEFGLMKQNAILVNTARGGLVDEAALLKELKNGKIWGAVLDAMETEPPTTAAYPELLKLDNVVVTPHVGGSTVENQSNSGCTVIRSCLAVLNGEKDVLGKLV